MTYIPTNAALNRLSKKFPDYWVCLGRCDNLKEGHQWKVLILERPKDGVVKQIPTALDDTPGKACPWDALNTAERIL